ncbi:hypothetical protein TNCV_2576821 [Trichonephila clavipes]|nr:hypothetical protein TNCV_2576821 [Trichonephila clavipes]
MSSDGRELMDGVVKSRVQNLGPIKTRRVAELVDMKCHLSYRRGSNLRGSSPIAFVLLRKFKSNKICKKSESLPSLSLRIRKSS